jgi:flagellar basal body-associated protein FliL
MADAPDCDTDDENTQYSNVYDTKPSCFSPSFLLKVILLIVVAILNSAVMVYILLMTADYSSPVFWEYLVKKGFCKKTVMFHSTNSAVNVYSYYHCMEDNYTTPLTGLCLAIE